MQRPTVPLNCPNCSAPYRGPDPSALTRSVKCSYCGAKILLGSVEEAANITRMFDQNELQAFLARKGVPYDPVSGGVMIAGTQLFIDSSGCVMPPNCPERLKQTVLRYIQEYVESSG